MFITPRPLKTELLTGQFVLDEQCTVFCSDNLSNSARYFTDTVRQYTGIELTFVDKIDDAVVYFTAPQLYNMRDDEYVIACADGKLGVNALTETSCFYAVQSLLMMFDVYTYQEGDQLTCRHCFVTDRPVYGYRALHLDIARHFYGVETIKKIVELMSSLKLNYLHLHLSDDQGFRVEIDKYPLVNKISSWRNGTEIRDGSVHIDDEVYGGYLTKQEVKDLVEYARSLHVEIVPELDLPGHMVSLLAAYPQYSCVGEGIEVRKKWGISKDLLCAGNDETYTFICDILDELVEMFPGQYFHLGGDEAPKDRWCNCKKCSAKLQQLHLDSFDELQTYMFNYFTDYLISKGKIVIGWNDGFTASTHPDTVCHHWAPKTDGKTIRMINKGRKAIMSPFFSMYFDYPYAMTPLKKTYRYNPERGVRKHAVSNILGVEGTVWTEHIRNTDKLFFNLLPRLAALSECAWGTNRHYVDFKKRLEGLEKIWDKQGLVYNHNATARMSLFKRLKTTSVFFKKDANTELTKK